MPEVVQIVIQARDNTGPGFAAAQTGLTGLSAAATRTELRAQSLTDRIRHQQDQLRLLGGQLDVAANTYGPVTAATERARIRFDALSASMQRNQATLQSLQTHGLSTGLVSSIGGVGNSVNRVNESVRSVNGTLEQMAMGVRGVNSLLGPFGVYLGAREVVQFGLDAGAAANRLEDTQTTVRQLSGTTQDYNRIVSAAISNQRLFGGSLESNLAGMQGMALVARNSKVDVAALNTVMQQLTFKSPEQGSAGAMIALNEVLTGKGAASTRSLQMRYELPAKMLREIERAPEPASKIAALNQALTDYGITADAINKRTETTSQAYRDLGIAFDNAKTKLGGYLSVAGAPAARRTADILAGVDGTYEGTQRAQRALGHIQPSGRSGFGGEGIEQPFRRRPNFGSFSHYDNVDTGSRWMDVPPVPIVPPPTTLAPPAVSGGFAGFGTQTIINHNYNIQGGLIAHEEVKAIAQQGQREYERRNGDLGYNH